MKPGCIELPVLAAIRAYTKPNSSSGDYIAGPSRMRRDFMDVVVDFDCRTPTRAAICGASNTTHVDVRENRRFVGRHSYRTHAEGRPDFFAVYDCRASVPVLSSFDSRESIQSLQLAIRTQFKDRSVVSSDKYVFANAYEAGKRYLRPGNVQPLVSRDSFDNRMPVYNPENASRTRTIQRANRPACERMGSRVGQLE
jgi:hypothetical protein